MKFWVRSSGSDEILTSLTRCKKPLKKKGRNHRHEPAFDQVRSGVIFLLQVNGNKQ
jgi:hypothetical protein